MSKLSQDAFFEIFGQELFHSDSGRPFFSDSFDVSVSHKDSITEMKIVLGPFRIGIDVESLTPGIAAEKFIGSVIGKKEIAYLKKYQKEKKLSLEAAVAIFWSLKEAFFKCLDCDLVPGKISVLKIGKRGKVDLELSQDVVVFMKKRKIELCSVTLEIEEGYAYAEVIMEVLV